MYLYLGIIGLDVNIEKFRCLVSELYLRVVVVVVAIVRGEGFALLLLLLLVFGFSVLGDPVA